MVGRIYRGRAVRALAGSISGRLDDRPNPSLALFAFAAATPANSERVAGSANILNFRGLTLDDSGKRVPLEVKAGEKILFGKYAGTEIKLEGEEHIILREDDVLAVIEG